MTLLNSIFVCAFLIDGKSVAEIFQTHNTFCWRHGQIISAGFSSLKEANLECLFWLKENTKLDISKIKTSSIQQSEQQVTAMSTGMAAYKAGFNRKGKLPPIHLTMPRLMKDPKWRNAHS